MDDGSSGDKTATLAEQKIRVCAKNGSAAYIEASKPSEKSHKNYVRAKFIQELITSGENVSGPGCSRIQIHGAWIEGDILFEDVTTRGSITFYDCVIFGVFFGRNWVLNGQLELINSTICKFSCVSSDIRSGMALHNVHFSPRFSESLYENALCSKDALSSKNALCSVCFSKINGNLIISPSSEERQYDKFIAVLINNSLVKGDIQIGSQCERHASSRCGPIIISGVNVEGDINIRNIDINIDFHLLDPHFLMRIDHCTIKKSIRFVGEANLKGSNIGGLSIRFSSIGGNILFGKTKLNVDARALSWRKDSDRNSAFTARFSSIEGSIIFGAEFELTGVLYLSSINVAGRLDLYGAKLTGNGTYGAEINNIYAGVFRLAGVAPKQFPIRLIVSHVRTLVDDINSWPDKIDLDGFTYDRLLLDSHVSREDATRETWLKKQHDWDHKTGNINAGGAVNSQGHIKITPEFKPQPWIHLRNTLIAQGEYSQAQELGIEFERKRMKKEKSQHEDRLSKSNWMCRPFCRLDGYLYFRIVKFLLGACTSYGYKPGRLFYTSVGVVVLYFIIYFAASFHPVFVPTQLTIYKIAASKSTQHAEIKCSKNWMSCSQLPEGYPQFNAFLYSLDVFLPVKTFQQESHWTATTKTWLGTFIFWLQRIETLCGWVVGLFLLSAASGVLKRRGE